VPVPWPHHDQGAVLFRRSSATCLSGIVSLLTPVGLLRNSTNLFFDSPSAALRRFFFCRLTFPPAGGCLVACVVAFFFFMEAHDQTFSVLGHGGLFPVLSPPHPALRSWRAVLCFVGFSFFFDFSFLRFAFLRPQLCIAFCDSSPRHVICPHPTLRGGAV